MTIQVQCPTCGSQYNISDDVRNKTGRCRGCQMLFRFADNIAGPPLPIAEAPLKGAASLTTLHILLVAFTIILSFYFFTGWLSRQRAEYASRTNTDSHESSGADSGQAQRTSPSVNRSSNSNDSTSSSVGTISKERAQFILHKEVIMDALRKDTDLKKVQESLDRIDRNLGIQRNNR